MGWISNKLKEWKEKRRKRILEKDKRDIEDSKERLKLWESAKKVEEAKLKVAKIKGKAKKLRAKQRDFTGITKTLGSLKNIGSALAKAGDNIESNIKRERKSKGKKKSDEFLDFDVGF